MDANKTNGAMKVIIVGGVAGGASCAARLRRLDERAEIVMVERGPYVSYANCGLPYYVGGVIPRESSLLVADERVFREQFAIEVRTRCEAIKISPQKKTVDLRNVVTGEVTVESYDKLVLSPGAVPIRPSMPGIDLPGVFKVRTVPDVREIREWLEGHDPYSSGMHTYTGYQTVVPAKRAVVVGGGFIGIEIAENLTHLGLQVTLLQRGPQVLSPMDPEMARYVEQYMEKHGVRARARRRRCRLPADGRRLAGGAHPIRSSSFRPTLPSSASACARRTGWPKRPVSRSAHVAAFAWMHRCAPVTRTSSRSATPSRLGTPLRMSGLTCRWPGRPIGRAVSQPM